MNTTIDELETKLKIYSINERYNTLAETRYWCSQYKDLADEAILTLRAQALLSQGEPVGKVTSKLGDICAFKSSQVNKGDLLYTAPPSTEALKNEVSAKIGKLQKDKAELIGYAKLLIKRLLTIKNSVNSNDYAKMLSNTAMASLAKEVLDISKPNCMKELEMKKHGIVIDEYKLDTFTRLLTQAGYTFDKTQNDQDYTYVLTVESDNTEALAEVVKRANSMSKI